MNAILWDGHNQLHGYLELHEKELEFRLKDFSDTSPHLKIIYLEIISVKKHKLYGIVNEGIEITSVGGRKVVFMVGDGDGLKRKLEENLNF